MIRPQDFDAAASPKSPLSVGSPQATTNATPHSTDRASRLSAGSGNQVHRLTGTQYMKTDYTLRFPPLSVLKFLELQHTTPDFQVSMGMKVQELQVLVVIGPVQIVAPWTGIVTAVGPDKITVRTDAAFSQETVCHIAYKSVIEAYREKWAREIALLEGKSISTVLDPEYKVHPLWFSACAGYAILVWYLTIARGHAYAPFVTVLATSVFLLLGRERRKVKCDPSHYTREWEGLRWIVPWLYRGSAIVALVTWYKFLEQLGQWRLNEKLQVAAIGAFAFFGLVDWVRRESNKNIRIAERLNGFPEDSSSVMVNCVEVRPVDLRKEF